MTPLPWRMRRAVLPSLAPWRPLADAWGLSPEGARLAWMRDADGEELAWRLDPAWARATDPYLLPGVGEAAARIRAAVAKGESICVYGDYDVDGVTATALLMRVLERLGAKASFFIPNRFNDGYGLNLECIREVVAQRGPALLVSVDCGVRSVAEVEATRELGAEWIVTDHHALGEALPPCIVVHPALGDYPNPNLAGVGVAFKLAQALLDAAPAVRDAEAAFLDGLLKLVALGTVADMVPLRGENALLVKRGLLALAGANGPGISALLRAAKVEGAVRARDIGYQVGPRLNAVGRMGGAEDAVRLLLAKDAATAQALMARVEALNLERREIQKALAQALPAPTGDPFDLVVEPEAHKGVIGIVAGHRMREHLRPSAVCTVMDGVAHCSVRAPEGYDLRPILETARPYLLSGGGHRYAAGMTFALNHLAFVKATLNRCAREQAEGAPASALLVDGAGTGLAPDPREMERLEPFGQGFPEPVLRVQGRLQGAPRTFGDGWRKFRLGGEDAEFTLFADTPRSLEGDLCLAVVPQDSPRWGRSWRVEGELDPREAP
jgi:single-stranded-DNA-specific exonuclease